MNSIKSYCTNVIQVRNLPLTSVNNANIIFCFKAFTGSSPQSKMEMAISMTGRERRQYMEWKAERERVDKERIERQKSASGEWRREWDAEKNPQE